jgi:hypothetical protein
LSSSSVTAGKIAVAIRQWPAKAGRIPKKTCTA